MAEQRCSVIFVKCAVSDLMQYKCDYNQKLTIYTRGTLFTVPDISDLDIDETKGFLMYVPVEAASTKGAFAFQRAVVMYNEDYTNDKDCCFVKENLFANKLNVLRAYAFNDCDGNDIWEFNFDIYQCSTMNVGGNVFTDLGRLCHKNAQLYDMMVSILSYELYARLDTFKYFTKNNAAITARHALERLISIKVCAQIMLGLLWSRSHQIHVNYLQLAELYKLCIEIIGSTFLPDCNLDCYEYVLNAAQSLRKNVHQKYALVADCRVPIDMITFKINNNVGAPDTVDMYSFYIYCGEFLSHFCQLAGQQYKSCTNSQISFNVTFSNATQSQSNILRHISTKGNKLNKTLYI
nr:maco-A 146 [Mamestra configurata nucleopolyhedrovirus A]WRQ96871.1 maco-B 145 [Mamestra configurata nucleopolyhedrovirus B]WRQ97032.1 macoB145 [Mamestra configurata nucleopolyhedrovirus B]